MKPITWSFGMQSRAASRVGANPDLAGAAEAAARAGMTEAIVFGKDHTGFCFHPTKVGVTHPGLKINLTKGMTDELHKRGMKAIAYVNFGMDGEAARRRPEWLQESAPGSFFTTKDHFADLCLYSGYLDEYLLPILKEMLTDCGVDGFFLDTMSAFHYCCCSVCRADYKAKTGHELPLPEDKNNPEWNVFGPYSFRRMNDTIAKVRESIRKLRPDATVIFNHVGGPIYPFAFPGVPDGVVSCDPPAFFPWISLYSNYMSSLPVTGDVFIERFARGWGDRTANSDLTMVYKSAIIFMYGQRFCVGDRMHPEGRLAPGSLHAMNLISKTWRKMNRLIPSSAELAPDILFLYSETFLSGTAMHSFARSEAWQKKFIAVLGTYRLLLDCGRSFMVSPEMALERNLNTKRFLIISATEYLRPETEKLIRQFVVDGGNVLVAEILPRLDDDSIPDWLGIRGEASEAYQPCLYLPDFRKRIADSERILVRGDVRKIELSTARPLLFGYPQYDMTLMGGGYNSSAAEPADMPLLTVNSYGKGKVYFLNCALFTDYGDSASPEQRQWAADLLKKLWKNASFELESPSGNVEIASWRDGEKTSVHVLVNHGGRRGSLQYLYTSEQIDAPQPVYEVVLKVRVKTKNPKVMLNGKKTEFNRNGEFLHIPVRMDEVWKIVKVTE